MKKISTFFLIISFVIILNSYMFLDKRINVPDVSSVVLISIDTLRADHLGIYGYHRDTTPNLDNFFKDKTIFENAISPAPCTVPAVLQFLTGTFKHELDNKTLAEVLMNNGYNTAAIVSQHQFGNREDIKRDYSRGFTYFDIQNKSQKDNHGMTSRTAKEVTDRAINWLEKNSNRGKFFLWLHYFDPHDPYEPPEQFRMYDSKNSPKTGDRRAYLSACHVFNEGDISHFIGLYDGEIKYTDSQIGRVLDKLEKQDLIHSTIIIVIGDHGEWFGENGRWDHCQTLYDTEIHVLFLISVGGKKLGKYGRSSIPVSTLDVFPTVMNLLNIEYNQSKLDGLDLLNMPRDRKVFSVWMDIKVIRSREWKLFFYRDKVVELYNIKEDRHEKINLIDKDIEIKDRLTKEMGNFLDSGKQIEENNKKIIEQLKSIGYIN